MGKAILIGVVILAMVAGGIGVGKYLTGAKKEIRTPEVADNKISQVSVSPTMAAEDLDEEHEEDTGDAIKFAVSAKAGGFVPSVLKVKKGEKVQVVFTSAGGRHSWNIDEFEVGTNTIGEGEEEEVEFEANKIGTFEYYSQVDDRKEAGMSGKLIVE